MRYINVLLLLLISLHIKAQTMEFVEDLSWKITSIHAPDGEQHKALGFEGAQYDFPDFFSPRYYKILETTSLNTGFNAELRDAEFIPLTTEEKYVINGKHLGSTIKISVIPATQRKKTFQQISFIPLRKNPQTGQLEKMIKFRILLRGNKKAENLYTLKAHSYISTSILSSGKWIKIAVDSSAIYKITYEQLIDMGIPQPEKVRIYGYGGGMLPKMNNEPYIDDLPVNSIWFEKGSDGIFNEGDYLLFYAQGPRRWTYDIATNEFTHENHSYSNKSCYFLTSDFGDSPAPEIVSGTSSTYDTIITQFDDYRVIDQDNDNLLQSGRLWVGQKFDITTRYSFQFNFPNLVKETPLKITTHVLARAASNTTFQLKSQDQDIGDIVIPSVNVNSYTSRYANEKEAGFTNFFASSPTFEIDLEYEKSSASAKGWLNFLRINARRKLSMVGSQMAFRSAKSVGAGKTSLFKIENAPASLMVWDITQAQLPKQITLKFVDALAEFSSSTSTLREYIAIDPNDSFPSPEVIGEIPNQNLHGLPQPDMVIICPKKFTGYAAQIADLHRTMDSLKVSLVHSEDIFNEFSSGIPDVAAFRNFMKMFYDRAQDVESLPDYLLFFGDGSYDNKLESASNTNQILTYQSENSLNPTQSFVTDDFFGLLDDDEGEATGLIDIGIGRLPVNTDEEAQIVVDKILNYHSSSKFGNWRTTLCFIGDDEDNNTHMRDANRLAEFVEENYPQYQVQRIFLDAFPQQTTSSGQTYPDVNQAITESVNQGTLIMNYVGHGNENGLAHEHILTIEDILNWQNPDRMPLFMTATCEFSRFDNYRKTSAGEIILLRNNGGGIGLFTTTRLVFSSPNYVLNRNFYDYVFAQDEEGEHYRLGDIMRLTKRASGFGINKRNFTLLGDPALKLSYPKNEVKTLTLNNVNIAQQTDTLKALSKITITGQLQSATGQILNQFQGVVSATIYDKITTNTTLGNDENPFTYPIQNNILYKGKASVNEGEFSLTFLVPKDINYQYGTGKIAYYASNNFTDASGYNKTIIVGGSNTDKINDNQGPEIDLYMNDEQFAPGGITDANPVLLAIIQDSSGINTIGTAIGHDIIATLDGNSEQPIRLNDHYESELDNFQKGRITYQLTNLQEGEHRIQLKVWDNVNNSSETDMEFIVAENAELAIRNILNYPNPFTTNTGFYFEHNMPYQELDILIQILTVSGYIVKTLETTITPDGYRVGPIVWDGKDDYGNNIGKGVYFYRIKIRSEDGKVVNKFQKIVLLK